MKPQPRTALIALRELSSLTQAGVAELVGVSVQTVSAWERGLRTPSQKFQSLLAKTYGITLIELHRALGTQIPAEIEGHIVQGKLNHYHSLVQGAGEFAEISVDWVPDLLQTREYATVVEQSFPDVTESQVTDWVETRIERQEPIRRHRLPITFHAVIDEIVLRRRAGGPEVMGSQLDHLVTMAARPNITIQVIPDDGRSACLISTFKLVTKPREQHPFMAIAFDACGAHYHEDIKLPPFAKLWRHAQTIALAPEDSVRLIEQVRTTEYG